MLDHVAGNLNVAMLYQAVGTAQETIQAAILVQRLDTVIETTDHVVAARSLATTEDDTHVKGLLGRHGRIVALKGQLGHAIGAGE